MVDPLRYYDLERYLFDDVHRRFLADGSLGAFDLFSIIIWKANRAKSRIARRLQRDHGDLERAARQLTRALYDAPNARERLRCVLQAWGFRLPMASAILTVLWPEEFTVYDVRVCDELGGFHALVHRTRAESIWQGYSAYVRAVREATPPDLSLRDKDRFLWARSAARQLQADLASGFADAAPD